MSTAESPADIHITGLFSYPIKGCRVVTHRDAMVLTTGLRDDREWMLVDTRRSPAAFISQREYPAMATIQVRAKPDGTLEVLFGADRLLVDPPKANSLIKVRVWNHETVAMDAGDAAASWFAIRLALPVGSVRLVRFHPGMRRDCNALYAGDSGAHTYFADGYPILVANTSSLDDLNIRMGRDDGSAMPMNRFRPNIVVSGLPAWDEDHIDTLSIGAIVLKLVKPCVRCQVTTTDQLTGAVLSDEPLNTLARFRNNPDFGGVTFGWNAVVLTGGTVSVGDPAAVEYRF